MSFELRDIREWSLGTMVFPKYEVYDQKRRKDFVLTVCTFELYDSSGAVVDSGGCVVNNGDSDAVGNSIKTVQATINLSATWAAVGHYSLVFHVTCSSGETKDLMAPIKIRTFP